MVRIAKILDRNNKIRNKYISRSIPPKTKHLLKTGVLERNMDIKPPKELKYPMNSKIASMLYKIVNRNVKAPQEDIGEIVVANNRLPVFNKKISLDNIEGKEFNIYES